MGRAVTGQSMRGSFCAYAQASLLFAGKLTDVGDAGENGLEAVKQLKAIIAELLVLVHDHNLVEETVDGRAQRGEGGKRGRIILSGESGIDGGLSGLGASASASSTSPIRARSYSAPSSGLEMCAARA